MPPSKKRPERSADAPPPEELQEEQIIDLPAREALSIVDPGIFGVGIPIGRTADQPPGTGEATEATPPSSS